MEASYLVFANVMVTLFAHQISVTFLDCWMMQHAVPLRLQWSAIFGLFQTVMLGFV